MISSENRGKGYPAYPDRIPPGWRVVVSDSWPVNNPGLGRIAPTDLTKWRFRTTGEVEDPLELTYEEFQALPHVSRVVDHHCIDGWSYLGQRWTGVDFSVVKDLTGVRESAKYAMVEGESISGQRFPVDQDLLFADGQDGERLSPAAGFPLRVVAPGAFGYKNRKWVDRVRFCSERETDGLERAFAEAGVEELYTAAIASADPWTVDDSARKSFLRRVFASDVEQLRRVKATELLSTHAVPGTRPKVDEEEWDLCSLEMPGESPDRAQFVVNGHIVQILVGSGLVFAVEPICPHMGTDLSHAKADPAARTIACPLHKAVFDLATGACLRGSMGSDGAAFPPLRTYRIRIRDDRVLLLRDQAWGPLW